MSFIRIGRAFGAAFALVFLGFVAHAALTLPDTGLRLGDIYSITKAINQLNQAAFTAGQTANNAASRANCTAITNPLNEFTTVASTGSVCLPTATAGSIVFIANAGSNTMNVYSSNSPFTAGTADKINGTLGSTAYTSLTTGKNGWFISPANGKWYAINGQ